MDKRRAIQIMTKAAGNVCGCIGFVKDKNTRLNVPNTLLKKDIRDVIAQPAYKVFAVIFFKITSLSPTLTQTPKSLKRSLTNTFAIVISLSSSSVISVSS